MGKWRRQHSSLAVLLFFFSSFLVSSHRFSWPRFRRTKKFHLFTSPLTLGSSLCALFNIKKKLFEKRNFQQPHFCFVRLMRASVQLRCETRTSHNYFNNEKKKPNRGFNSLDGAETEEKGSIRVIGSPMKKRHLAADGAQFAKEWHTLSTIADGRCGAVWAA